MSTRVELSVDGQRVLGVLEDSPRGARLAAMLPCTTTMRALRVAEQRLPLHRIEAGASVLERARDDAEVTIECGL